MSTAKAIKSLGEMNAVANRLSESLRCFSKLFQNELLITENLSLFLSEELNIEHSLVKSAISKYFEEFGRNATPLKGETDTKVDAPVPAAPKAASIASTKSDEVKKAELEEKVEKSKAEKKFYCVESGRIVASGNKKYNYWEDGLCGIKGTEKLNSALELLERELTEPTAAPAEVQPTAAADTKPTAVVEEAPKKKMAISKNQFGNYWDPVSRLVFDITTRSVYGRQDESGEVLSLTKDDIAYCANNNLKTKATEAPKPKVVEPKVAEPKVVEKPTVGKTEAKPTVTQPTAVPVKPAAVATAPPPYRPVKSAAPKAESKPKAPAAPKPAAVDEEDVDDIEKRLADF